MFGRVPKNAAQAFPGGSMDEQAHVHFGGGSSMDDDQYEMEDEVDIDAELEDEEQQGPEAARCLELLLLCTTDDERPVPL